jgi:hypothetical protein
MSTDVEKTVKFTPTVLDGAAVNDGINKRIAEAETVDDLFAGSGETLSLQDIEGEYVTIESAAFHESSDQYKDGGWGIFAVLNLDDGRVITTGSKTVVLKLYKLQELTGYPLPFAVVFKGTQTRNGFTAWDMDKDRR